jgi:hypothetical protein
MQMFAKYRFEMRGKSLSILLLFKYCIILHRRVATINVIKLGEFVSKKTNCRLYVRLVEIK